MVVENGLTADELSTGEIIEELLGTLPDRVTQAIRLAAIPNFLTTKLLDSVVGPEVSGERLLPALNSLGMGHYIGQGRFQFRGPTQSYLRANLRQHDKKRFRDGNRAALEFFRQMAEQATTLTRPTYEGEVLYHLLAYDEPAGIRHLQQLFEEARSRYQLGLAQEYLGRAQLQQSILTEDTRGWLRYFQARLDSLRGRKDEAKEVFRDLAPKDSQSSLAAAANWSLGELLYQDEEWTSGISRLQQSLKQMKGLGMTGYSAEVMLSLGEAYEDMAKKRGGIDSKVDRQYGTVNRALHGAQNLPFLIIEWLVRHVSFMPRWYASTNYQDWIISRLLTKASDWYGRAEKTFDRESQRYGLIRARLLRANVEHRLGHWSRARKRYRALNEEREVRESLYRTALVQQGQGQAYFAEGKLPEAEEALASALDTFLRFDDKHRAGETAAHLGYLFRDTDRPAEAAETFMTSMRSYLAVENRVAEATEVSYALAALQQGAALPEEQASQATAFLAAFDRRRYLERFPDKLLKNFRLLAYWAALPITYILALTLTIILTLGIAVIESSFILPLTGTSLSSVLFEILTILLQLIMPALLTLWLYRLIYTLTGIAYVRVLGRNLDKIQEDQPGVYDTNRQQILYRDATTRKVDADGQVRQEPESLGWMEAKQMTSIEIMLVQRTIHLGSSQLLQDGAGTFMSIDGITTGYEHLKHDIRRHLGERIAEISVNLDFVVLKPRWVIITVALALAAAIALTIVGRFYVTVEGIEGGQDIPPLVLTTEDPGGEEVFLPLSSVLVGFGPTALLFFAPITFWRLVHHNRRVTRETGSEQLALPTWWFSFAAAVGSILAILWLLLVTVILPSST